MTSEEKLSSIIREYRIVLPLSVDEYHIGQLYGVAEASKNETGGGEGVEVRTNEHHTCKIKGEGSGKEWDCQYTYKVMHLSSKVPKVIRLLAPRGSLELHEEAWNAYPYCRTEYSNPYMKDAFHIIIETRHEPGTGDIENVHHLTPKMLAKRTIERIDIADNTECKQEEYKENEDPTKFKSEKTGRGPLQGKEWTKSQDPVMCCYKLYQVEFKWWGLQTKIESIIMRSVRRLLYHFHRQVFCWLDKWFGMTIEDIRTLEAKTKEDLDELRSKGHAKGMAVSE